MDRNILIISILVVLMVIILSFIAMQNKLVHVPKLHNMINSTDREDVINTNPIYEDTKRSTTLDSNENIGRIASFPPKCLGSALCPD
jgi:hypothetical protein